LGTTRASQSAVVRSSLPSPRTSRPRASHSAAPVELPGSPSEPRRLGGERQRVAGRAQVGDVDEGHDDAVDAVVDVPVRPDAHDLPAPVAGLQLALDRRKVLQHLAGMLGENFVDQLMGEIGDRPADVGVGDVEELGDPWREHADPQLGVEEQGADIGGDDDVLEVAVRCADRVELALQLRIDGLQLLVHRLQLLLRGLELLGGRAVLLVDRLQLLVGDAQVLDRGFMLGARRSGGACEISSSSRSIGLAASASIRSGAASFGKDGIELVDGLEVAIDDRLVDERPEVLGGLQLGGCRTAGRPAGCLRGRRGRARSASRLRRAPG
jgi:hypothetical protein